MANRKEIKNLQDLIKDSIGGEVVEQSVELLLPPGENYGSVMYKVDFKVRKDGKEEEYHAVAKCTPPNIVTQEHFNTQVTFKSEIGWYSTVIPTLKQFEREVGVQAEMTFFQPFYGARISLDPKCEKVDLDGVILTQNLKYLGYHNIDRHIGFDLPTTHNILRDLATFHAVLLALKTKKPDLFNSNVKPYLAKCGATTEELKQGYNKPMFDVLEQIPECQPIMEKIRKFIAESNVFGERPVREPWATVIHLDFWTNNIMITEGKDPKTMILDFQVPCVGSPAADLVFFLLTSVKLDIIKDKFDDLVKYYFEQFLKHLSELNVPNEKYTLEGLYEEIETEVRIGEFNHVLGHTCIIMGEKGKTDFNSADANFKKENLGGSFVIANDKQIEKFKWIIFECIKRKWIRLVN